jgi:CDP-6-deoxy-D-xylo-4-hexulose-3-dehydrase
MRFSQQFGELPFGYDHKYVYSHIGYNLKATDIQAALGLAQIKKLNLFVDKRRKNLLSLYEWLKEYSNLLILPEKTQNSNPSWFGFPITIRDGAGFKRSDFVNYLEKNKIATRMLFAGNITKQPAYLNIKKRIYGGLTNTDKIMNDSFFVGVYPGIGEEQINYMLDIFNKFLKKYN